MKASILIAGAALAASIAAAEAGEIYSSVSPMNRTELQGVAGMAAFAGSEFACAQF